MKELAMEELKILEANHPTRFQNLKLHIKEFIHLLNFDEDEGKPSFRYQHHQSDPSIITQESSSRRKRKKEKEEEKDDDDDHSKSRKRRRKEGDAIQKAEACLRKIQDLKSFFLSSNR